MSQVIAVWRDSEITLLSSPQTRAELSVVLSRSEIQERSSVPLTPLLEGLTKFSVHVPGNLEFIGGTRDPKDDKFIACAVEGEAQYLISSYQDLLEVHRHDNVCILNPGEFLVALQIIRLPYEEIATRYSLDTLETIRSEIDLDVKSKDKLHQAIDVR